MALARADPAAKQQAGRGTGCDSLAERGEAILNGGLAAAGRGNRVPAGHAGPQRLNGTAPRHGRVWADGRSRHATPSGSVPIRTRAEYGLTRRRSRTSSTTRSRSAV